MHNMRFAGYYDIDTMGADNVHATISPLHVDRRDAGQTDALCRRSSAVRPARPY